MSADDYTQVGTHELIQAFVQKADIIGSAWNLTLKIHKKTLESKAMVQDIYAISAELMTRNPFAQIRERLFDHESRDVRGWAAGQFLTIDPEWASATFSGLAAHLSTREVLALSARARLGPPAHPALEEMSTDQLIARFEDAGIREYATRFLGEGDSLRDDELCNRFVGEIIAIAAELKSRNGLAGLLLLLESPNVTVRHRAARHCLTVAPARAVPVLEAVIASPDPHQLGPASRALERWREGKLK